MLQVIKSADLRDITEPDARLSNRAEDQDTQFFRSSAPECRN